MKRTQLSNSKYNNQLQQPIYICDEWNLSQINTVRQSQS